MKWILVLLLFAQVTHAAMANSFKFTGVVQGYDKHVVRVICQNKKVSIPRDTVVSGEVRAGESVNFELTGEQMKEIFLTNKK